MFDVELELGVTLTTLPLHTGCKATPSYNDFIAQDFDKYRFW